MFKRFFFCTLIMALGVILLFVGCGLQPTESKQPAENKIPNDTSATSTGDVYQPSISDEDIDSTWSADEAVHITFSDGGATTEGNGAAAVEGGVKISKSGVYHLTGSCSDGRVVVDVDGSEWVTLVLEDLNLTSSSSAPLNIANGNAKIILAEGSQNTLTDAKVYQYADSTITEPNACLFGDDNITITGSGALTINGNFNNGIGVKNELRIVSGTIVVNAVNNAVKGNDCVLICNGDIKLNSEDDGIKSDSEDPSGYGVVSITGGTIEIICGDDGIQAFSGVSVTGGTVKVTAGGKRVNCDGALVIAPGCMP